MLCCGYTLTDFPISIRLTSLALWQSNDCPSASKATLMNMDKYFMWIHYERLHNHNKAKHNKTVCIFLGICCTRSLNVAPEAQTCLNWLTLRLSHNASLHLHQQQVVEQQLCHAWHTTFGVCSALYQATGLIKNINLTKERNRGYQNVWNWKVWTRNNGLWAQIYGIS